MLRPGIRPDCRADLSKFGPGLMPPKLQAILFFGAITAGAAYLGVGTAMNGSPVIAAIVFAFAAVMAWLVVKAIRMPGR